MSLLRLAARRAAKNHSSTSTYASQVLALSPLAFYKMDETSGTVMHDATTNARNGTFPSSGITFSQSPRFPKLGNAVRLSFALATVPYASWQDLTGDFTVVFIASIATPGSGFGSFPKLVAKFYNYSVGYATYMFQGNNSNKNVLGRVTTTGNNYNDINDAANLMDGTAHMFVLRRSGTTLSLKIDNVLIGNLTVSGANQATSSYGIQIGGSGSTDGIDMTCQCLSIHGNALTDAQLTSLYAALTT